MQNRQVILYVDNEHASTYERSTTEWLLAARARITYRLGDLTGRLSQRLGALKRGVTQPIEAGAKEGPPVASDLVVSVTHVRST